MILDSLNKEQIGLLGEISDPSVFGGEGAYNLRLNGHGVMLHDTGNIEIVPKDGGIGIDVYIRPGTVDETVHIPVIISQSGLKETVFNDFHVGEGCDVTIIAGCGIHNAGDLESMHSGVHSFYVGKKRQGQIYREARGLWRPGNAHHESDHVRGDRRRRLHGDEHRTDKGR